MNEVERINMARTEINAAVNKAGEKYGLPPFILDLIISGALADVRGQSALIDTINREKLREAEQAARLKKQKEEKNKSEEERKKTVEPEGQKTAAESEKQDKKFSEEEE